MANISFTALLHESKKIARRLRYDFSVSDQDAEDAVSAAWESILERSEVKFENVIQLRAWVKKDAAYRLMNLKKHRHRFKSERFEDRLSDVDKARNYNDVEHRFDGKDAHRMMLACLNIHERSVIMIHHLLDLSFEEISGIRPDGLSADVLRQRYHRAMKKLQAFAKKKPQN